MNRINLFSRIESKRTPIGISSEYFARYKEQLELFHLINGRGHLFFQGPCCS